MHELTADNVLDYLRARKQLGSGSASVETLSGGVSNAVLRIVTPERTFVVKQSRPQLRTRDAWFSDLNRVYREQEVMEALQPILGSPTVPEILFSDRDNYVFAMAHAPAGSVVWKQRLLQDDIDPERGRRAGKILGRIHEHSARAAQEFARFREHTVFVQLRVEPFYQRIQERRPEVAAVVGKLAERMLALDEALCHGDFSPKNLLAHDTGFTLVDYETAHLGDPTMDLGFFLSHLLLKTARRPTARARFLTLIDRFWDGYTDEVRFRPMPELTARGIEHLGVCLLARIDGTSPVDYLPEEPKREAVRRLGTTILLDRPTRWSEVRSLIETQFPC